jgi:uracil-DNA glycosylase family 4
MGFFGMDDKPEPSARVKGAPRGVQLSTLHEQGCNMCPLNAATCKTPKMKPTGSKEATVYILGTAPSAVDDKQGKPFSDDAGRYVRSRVPGPWRDMVRYGNVIKTYPGMGVTVENKNRDDKRELTHVRNPEYIEIECCRPQVRADILKIKPEAVIVVGGVALRWIAEETHAYLWQGRRFPATIADGDNEHTFWVYPMTHPYEVIKNRRWDGHVPDDEMTWSRQFRNIFRELNGSKAPTVITEKQAMAGVECVMGEGKQDLYRIEKHLQEACTDTINGVDYETSVLRPYNDDSKILTASVTHKGGTLAFPFDHKEALWTPAQRDYLDDMWTEYLCDDGPIKIAHQLAFELEWSAVEFGVEVMNSKWGDSISQAYILNEKQGMLALEVLTQQYYGINIKSLSNVNRKRMADEPLKRILPYNGMDSKFHRKLFLRQAPLIAEQGLEAVYEHQIARIPALVRTQMHGIPIDQGVLADLRKPWVTAQTKALAALKELDCWRKYEKQHGSEFNPASSHDLKKMLTMLGQPKLKGDEKQLKAWGHPLAAALIKWRKPTKVLSTYCEPITPGTENCQLMDDAKIHPIISTYKVETWRTSSEDPNIQNWPVRGPNYVIRKVVAKTGKKIVKFDYAGIQARNIAMESEDAAFMQAFFDWYDIHTEWSNNFKERMPKWAPAEFNDPKVFKEVRSFIKNSFVFPSFFGAKANSITVSINAIPGIRKHMPVEVVQELQDDLFNQFPRIKKWQEKLKAFYDKNGYVTGHSGFKRRAPISYNQLINSPIQGDESIIVLSAHIACVKRGLIPMMEIHDDLTFLWDHDKVEKNSEIVITEMLKHRFDWINVPLVVERAIGDNWAECEKAGEFESVGPDDWREHGGGDKTGFTADAYLDSMSSLRKQGSAAAKRRKEHGA